MCNLFRCLCKQKQKSVPIIFEPDKEPNYTIAIETNDGIINVSFDSFDFKTNSGTIIRGITPNRIVNNDAFMKLIDNTKSFKLRMNKHVEGK